MRQRGRKSAESLVALRVDGKPPKLDPPASLGEAERKTFIEIVDANRPEHFRASDMPLLCRYCEAAVLGEQAAQELRHDAVIDSR
jgi:hypothetical protein